MRQRNAAESAEAIDWSEVRMVSQVEWEGHAKRGEMQVGISAKGCGWKEEGKACLEHSGH